MTDFEIIKKELNQCKATYEILKAAERMAAENNNWKDAFKTKVVDNEELERCFNNAIVEIVKLNDEIARLKAELEDANQQISDMRGCLHDYEEIMSELEKRPEVVRCGECVRKDTVNCSTSQYCGAEGIDGHWRTQTTDDFYCAVGVKKESEEKR